MKNDNENDVVVDCGLHNIDDHYMISQFLANAGSDNIDIMCNLYTGMCLDTLTTEVSADGSSLVISYAFCPTFHNMDNFIKSVREDPN